MTKTKLALCIGDEHYQSRFVKCLMNHYQNQFEVYLFTRLTEILSLKTQEYEVIIVGDCDKEELGVLVGRGENLLYLCEDEREKKENTDRTIFVEKYQEVYKIVDHIEQLTGHAVQRVERAKEEERQTSLLGVFSLSKEEFQLAFSATLCSICSEEESVLLINTQPYSCTEESKDYWENDEITEILGMEDCMAVATTGVYTKGRLLAGIGREQNWEYIHTIRNFESLAEGSVEIYQTMIDILTKELDYKTIVINFGGCFSGVQELMDSCDEVFFLTEKVDRFSSREKVFMEAMKRNERNNFLSRVTRVEIPAIYRCDENWRQLAQQWCWNELGEILRESLWVRKQHEGFM